MKKQKSQTQFSLLATMIAMNNDAICLETIKEEYNLKFNNTVKAIPWTIKIKDPRLANSIFNITI